MNRVTQRIKTVLIALIGTLLLASSLAVQAGETVTYVQTDIQGNPVTKTDSSGKVIWRQSYAPYGRTYPQADPNGPGYTGHRHDAATGLVYMQARYYDPKIGRFLSPDPVTFSPENPAYFNRYWYAKGNPYKYTDPDGREPMIVVPTPEGPILLPVPPMMGQEGLGAQTSTSNVLSHLQNNFNQNTQALGSAVATAIWNATHETSDSTESASEKIKVGTKPATGISGKKGEREGSGGQVGANDTFDGVKGLNERTYASGTKAKDLSDGGVIETHKSTGSKDYAKGTPTVKVQDANGKVISTVRYPRDQTE